MTNKKLKKGIASALSVAIAVTMAAAPVSMDFLGGG